MDESKDVLADDAAKTEAAEAIGQETVEAVDEVAEQVRKADASAAEDVAAEAAEADDTETVADDAAIVAVAEAAAAVDEQAESAPESAPEPVPTPAEEPKSLPTAISIGSLVTVGILALIMAVLLSLPSFLGGTPQGTAATVNGTAISESEITEYIMMFRERQGMSEDDWGTWLVDNGLTPEQIRTSTVEYFVNRELIKQAVDEQGVTIEESAVDEYIDSVKAQFSTEEEFEEALAAQGLTMDEWREEVRLSLLQEALMDKVASADDAISDDDILQVIKLYFPDAVDADAESLDGVDAQTIEQVRSMLVSSAKQETFSKWMEEFRAKATIDIAEAPESLPYAIDLAPYEEQAKLNPDDGGLILDDGEGEMADGDEDVDADGEADKAAE